VVWTPEADTDPEAVEQAITKAFLEKDLILDQLIQIEKIPLDPRHNSKVDYTALRNALLKPT
jgi:hypothetical protein